MTDKAETPPGEVMTLEGLAEHFATMGLVLFEHVSSDGEVTRRRGYDADGNQTEPVREEVQTQAG